MPWVKQESYSNATPKHHSQAEKIAIEHTLPSISHSYSPCDKDFPLIRKAKRKKKTIYVITGYSN
jgi:hypothetical protein